MSVAELRNRYYGTGHRKNATARVWIAAGTGTQAMAAQLERAGVLRSQYAFDLLRAIKGGKLIAGEYRFNHPAPATDTVTTRMRTRNTNPKPTHATARATSSMPDQTMSPTTTSMPSKPTSAPRYLIFCITTPVKFQTRTLGGRSPRATSPERLHIDGARDADADRRLAGGTALFDQRRTCRIAGEPFIFDESVCGPFGRPAIARLGPGAVPPDAAFGIENW